MTGPKIASPVNLTHNALVVDWPCSPSGMICRFLETSFREAVLAPKNLLTLQLREALQRDRAQDRRVFRSQVRRESPVLEIPMFYDLYAVTSGYLLVTCKFL